MIDIDENLNKIILGDNRVILKEFPDNCVDFVLTSPPYNIGKILGASDIPTKTPYKKYKDELNEEQYFNFLVEVIDQLLRITRKYIIFNIMYVSKNRSALFKLVGKYADNIKDVLIWEKKIQPAMCKGVLTHNYEFILILSKQKENRNYEGFDFGRKGDFRTCFKEKDNSAVNPEAFWCDVHFAIMSINLARRMLETFTKENELILDPFMGVGTTGVACKELKRNFIGIEIDEECIKKATERLNTISTEENNVNGLF